MRIRLAGIRRSIPRWTVPAELLLLIASAYWVLVNNGAFWRALASGYGGRDGAVYLGAVSVALVALHCVLLLPLMGRWTTKPVLVLTALAAAAAGYYAEHFGVQFDTSMLRNVLQTDPAEARELLTPRACASMVLSTLPLLALLTWVRVRELPFRRMLLWRGLALLAAFLVCIGAIGSVFKDLSSQVRNQRELRFLMIPAAPLWSLGQLLTHDVHAAGSAATRRVVGADARLGPSWSNAARPALLVVVVGETARAADWGLNAGVFDVPETTPQLRQRDVINFPDVRSCGTSTAVSLPCMFSRQGRRHYDEDLIRTSDSLLHVLQRAGLRVVWNDNQSGCKGVCDGLETMRPDPAALAKLCSAGRCLDEALLESSRELLSGQDGSLVLVLHMMGNHGPAYHRRYPASFRRFMPSCESDDLSQCSQAQIRNSYDNALLYTDHVLAGTIDWLASISGNRDTAMLYVSDHGESLGELGLYLHGAPYAIAPREQKWVPMVMWFSRGFANRNGLDTECLRQQSGNAASHDNLFDTVLGLLDVKTSAYDRTLDLGAPCRG